MASSSATWLPAGAEEIPIWHGAAPDMPSQARPKESASPIRKVPGRFYTAVANVSAPTMTVFQPASRKTDAAIIVFPGGGFRILAIDLEGTEICDWVTRMGATCVLLKYRVPGGNDYWDDTLNRRVTPPVPLALQDAQRTIRLVRANAASLGVDPAKVGVIGFSAGGYLVAQTSNIVKDTYRPVDAADALSSRPDFAMALYPGHLCRDGHVLEPSIQATKQTPPTFLLQAWDDPVDPICNSTLYASALEKAGASAEVHLFSSGGHAFGLRSPGNATGTWPELAERWLRAQKLLPSDQPASSPGR
ncbi:alpha/beta hydrolase [Cognatilysobacter segetis]|uniref:alpha/beta hydrolase n=1 Tax=Cognatilysobacter segetis TaxID=2492394 RepID=UPI003CCD9294